MSEDRAEIALQGAALAITLGLIVVFTTRDILPSRLAVEAPKPTQVTLSVVEEPPPAPPPPPPAPEVTPPPDPLPPPPPPQAAPSPLPPPPPPKPPRRPLRLRHPPRPAIRDAPPPVQQPQAVEPRPPSAAKASQAPENHSAEAAYVGRLHALVSRNTRPPDSPAYRLSHPPGDVELGFTLSRDGTVSNVHILASSGHPVLDQQGLLIVSGLRFPPMPDEVYPGQFSHAFTVPVGFLPEAGGADNL